MAKGDSEYIYFIVVHIADNIRIIEIEYVLKYLLAFNYVISRSEELKIMLIIIIILQT